MGTFQGQKEGISANEVLAGSGGESLGSRCGQAPTLLGWLPQRSKVTGKCECEERVCVKPNPKKELSNREAGGATVQLPKTSSKMTGLLAQMICHPVEIWLLPQNATMRLISSPFKMFT